MPLTRRRPVRPPPRRRRAELAAAAEMVTSRGIEAAGAREHAARLEEEIAGIRRRRWTERAVGFVLGIALLAAAALAVRA